MAAPPVPGRPTGSPTYAAELVRTLRVVLVSGVLVGLVIGLLLRLAMLLLRLTSPEAVGLLSDDGFEIGVVSLFGIYNLAAFGIALAVAGSAAYVSVAPFLLGPEPLRVLTVAVTAMLLGGSAAIHDSGTDFRVLDPELSVAAFLVVPFVAGLLVPLVVGLVDRRVDAWPRWLPVLALLHPLLAAASVLVGLVVAALLPLRRALLEPVLAHRAATGGMRVLFALVPLAAGLALVEDLRAVLG